MLDRPELETMRNGFAVGATNKRGVTSRAYDEGGGQERELAGSYRAHARALHISMSMSRPRSSSWPRGTRTTACGKISKRGCDVRDINPHSQMRTRCGDLKA